MSNQKPQTVEDFFKRKLKIPSEWEYPKFASIVEVNPLTKINSKNAPYVPMDAVDTSSPHIKYFEDRVVEENSSLPRFQENDILFARITPSTENGKTSIVENFSGQGIASSELTVLRPTKKIEARYLYYYIKSDRIRQFAISQMSGSTGRQRVPDYVFKKDLNVELPPIKEQRKIIEILSKVDSLINLNKKLIGIDKKSYEVEVNYLEKLKRGLMQKLLTGQIRVKY